MKKDKSTNLNSISAELVGEPQLFGEIIVYQADTIEGDINLHNGRCIELVSVIDGSGTVYKNGTTAFLERGDTFLSFPKEAYEVKSDFGIPLKCYHLAFLSKNTGVQADFEAIPENSGGAHIGILKNEDIRSSLRTVIEELQSKHHNYELAVGALLMQIAVYVIREFNKVKTGISTDIPSDRHTLCENIKKYIDSHIYTLKNLELLADVFRYNYNYLSNVFKETTGETIASYYRSTRLELAKNMLLLGKTKVTDVALSLGYSSVYTFSRAYKSMYGIAPKSTKGRSAAVIEKLKRAKEVGHAELAVTESVSVFDFKSTK